MWLLNFNLFKCIRANFENFIQYGNLKTKVKRLAINLNAFLILFYIVQGLFALNCNVFQNYLDYQSWSHLFTCFWYCCNKQRLEFLRCKYAMLILGLKICFVFNVELLIITDVKQIIENLKFEIYVFMDKVFFMEMNKERGEKMKELFYNCRKGDLAKVM